MRHSTAFATITLALSVFTCAAGAEPFSPTAKLEGAGPALAFSPDGSLLARAGNKMIRFLDTKTWSVIREIDTAEKIGGFAHPTRHRDNLAFSPDGKLLAAVTEVGNRTRISSVNIVGFWDIKSGRRVNEVLDQELIRLNKEKKLPEYNLSWVAFHPSGKLVYAANSSGMPVIAWKTGQPVKSGKLKDHTWGGGPVQRIVMSTKGSAIAFGCTMKTMLVRVSGGRLLTPSPIPATGSIGFSANGNVLAVAGFCGEFRSPSPGRPKKRPPGMRRNPKVPPASRHSPPSSAKDTATLTVWNVNPGKLIEKCEQSMPMTAVAVSPKGDYVAVGDKSGRIRLWCVSAKRVVAESDSFRGSNVHIHTLQFHPKGKWLVSSGSPRMACRWDVSQWVP